MLRTATSVGRGVLSTLLEYEKEDVLTFLLDTVDGELETQLNLVFDRLVKYRELNATAAEEFKASFPRLREQARSDIKKAVKAGIAAVKKAEGTKKLKEALNGLDIRERFNVNNRPAALPPSISELWPFFGVPKQSPGVAQKLKTQWQAHCDAWKPPAPGVVFSNCAVFKYWDDLTATSPELAEIATLQWLRPISSASVERIYSILTHMDVPTRRTMVGTSLIQLLFLAGNAHIVGDLLHEFAESVRRPAEAAVAMSLGKRKRGEAAAAAQGAEAASAALHAGAAAAAATEEGEAVFE